MTKAQWYRISQKAPIILYHRQGGVPPRQKFLANVLCSPGHGHSIGALCSAIAICPTEKQTGSHCIVETLQMDSFECSYNVVQLISFYAYMEGFCKLQIPSHVLLNAWLSKNFMHMVIDTIDTMYDRVCENRSYLHIQLHTFKCIS